MSRVFERVGQTTAGSAPPAAVTFEAVGMPETLTERDVARILRCKAVVAREALRADGVRVIDLPVRRWRVDAEEFAVWLRGNAERTYGPEETATP